MKRCSFEAFVFVVGVAKLFTNNSLQRELFSLWFYYSLKLKFFYFRIFEPYLYKVSFGKIKYLLNAWKVLNFNQASQRNIYFSYCLDQKLTHQQHKMVKPNTIMFIINFGTDFILKKCTNLFSHCWAIWAACFIVILLFWPQITSTLHQNSQKNLNNLKKIVKRENGRKRTAFSC